MEVEQLNKIISQGEGTQVEFKKAEYGLPGSFYESVVSFSNTDGGTILLGVLDNGKIAGIDPHKVTQLKKDIITTLNNRNSINPPVYVQPFTVSTSDGVVMVVQIPVSSQVHSYNKEIYFREHDVDINITNDQKKIGDIYLKKRNYFTETKIYPYLTLDDLNEKAFQKALKLIKNNRSDHPWLELDKMEILQNASLWRKDFETGEEGLTLAAALIFGKDTTIQSLLPAYKVEAMVRIENKDRYDDRINPPLRTNLIDTYLELKAFINKHLPEKFYLEGDQRIDLRDKIFREIIGNVIVHREYTSALATEIIISESEVIITNPTKPLFHGLIDPNSFNPYPKNPNIRKFFTALGWADEIGSGIRNTFKYVPLYVSGAKPIFIENDNFITRIPLVAITLKDFSKEWINWIEIDLVFKEHIYSGLKNIQLPPSLKGKNWQEVLLYLVPSWHNTGTQLNSLNWDEKQPIKKEELLKIPSFDKKSTQLLGKKNRYFIGILSLCAQPIKSSEILKAFNYKNEKTFRDNYLKPLRETGFIEFTIPDKPTDPNNKYKITEKGAAFLGGIYKEV
ncbi:MAG: hypothetical protein Kow00108_11490 [Calditrichia bacterium]